MVKYIESKFKKFFKSINIYGVPFSIKYKNESTYTSIIGVLLSIFSILFLTGFSIYYLCKLINHSSFSVLTCNDRKKFHSINLSNIPIMFGLLDTNSKLLSINQEIFSLSVWIKTLNPVNNSFSNINFTRIEIESCLNSEYIKLYPDMKQYNLEKYLCIKPNQNIELRGRYGDSINGFSSLNIYFGHCISVECLQNRLNEINNVLTNSYLSVIYLSDVIDHYNYKEPLVKTFRSENFEMTPLSFKKYIYYFSSMIYMSDNGLFLNKYKKYYSFMFDHIHLDFVGRNNSDSEMYYDNNFYSMTFQISFSCADYPVIFNRKYLKIQDIFSQIGGFIDFIYIVCNFITIYISKKNLVVDIADSLVCLECVNACTKNYLNVGYNISKFIKKNKSSDLYSTNLIYSKIQRFSLNDIQISDLNSKNVINYHKTITNNNNALKFRNSKLEKYLEKKILNQRLKISSYFDYLLPYICLKKFKQYQLLCTYTDILYSYLSLEEILPSIERISRLFKEKKGDLFLKTQNDPIFCYKDENNELVLTSFKENN